ncbi:MAG: hypothetical protein K8R88_14465 [Armatimonadetes bacterium]|nr:hypothetical protein [Armatimonadota bacterium]
MQRIWVVLASAATVGISTGADAQGLPNLETKGSDAASTVVVGGKTSVDLIRLEPNNPSVPLRNAGVLPGSETIEINGRPLRKGTEYTLDYGSGMVYLMVKTLAGQSLRATYRHDPSRAVSGGSSSKSLGIHGFTFDFAGGNQFMMGLGVADRKPDGTVTTSNVYGLKNNISLAPGMNIAGFYVLGQQKKVVTSSQLDHEDQKTKVDEGQTKAMVQALKYNALGGSISANYQDIGSKFSAFDSFRGAGFTDQQVNQLGKEKGLKRSGFQVDKIGTRGLQFSTSQKIVGDSTEGIDWRSYGLQAGAFSLKFDRTKVDSGFKRFNDLAEADRAQLAKEAGLTQERLAGEYKAAGFMAKFNEMQVSDKSLNGVYRRLVDVEFAGAKLNFSNQKVDQKFNQFGGLREADAGQLAREQGIRRESFSLNYSPLKNNGLTMKVSESSMAEDATDGKSFESQDISIAGKTWNFTRMLRSSDAGNTRLGSMSDGEIYGHIKSIAMMYDPCEFQTKPEEKFGFTNGSGISRELQRMSWTPKTGINLVADVLNLGGKKDGGSAQSFRFTSPKVSISHRKSSLGEGFDEASRLMEFERNRVGGLTGVNREDSSINYEFSKGTSFAASSMSMGRKGEGEATRTNVKLQSKGLEFSANTRSVDAEFASLNQLADPERDLLLAMKGFKEKDFRLKWDMLKGLRFALQSSDSTNEVSGETKGMREMAFDYQPDRYTKLNYYKFDKHNDSPEGLIFGNSVQSMSFAREIKNLGAISYAHEKIDFDGSDAKMPDSDRTTLALSAKLDPKTQLSTERTDIEYGDGGSERIRTNTISKEIGNKIGVSVSQTNVDRDGDKADEEKRNYGFWYDFGHGLRLNYGMQRQVNSTVAGGSTSQFSVSPGQVGNFNVESAVYNDQRWDGSRYQATGNVAFGLTKGITLGPLKDFKFRYSADTLRDHERFQRENRRFSTSTSLLGSQLGYDYFSQVAPTGERAIDRTIRFGTAKNDRTFLSADFFYKIRTMPNDKTFAIRNYDFKLRPSRSWVITHTLQTNPEDPRGDLLLGSLPRATRSSKWRIDLLGSKQTNFGLTLDEYRDDNNKNMSRVGGVNLKLNASNPSPIELYYGLEHNDAGGKMRTAHRYHIRFDQRPGENQSMSLFLGNVSWQNSRATEFKVQNWSVRTEYQIKF